MPNFDHAPSLKDLLAGAHLPAMPQSAIRIMNVAQNPDNGPVEFAAPIEADPGLTGQVLRFVNSSYFGFSREISSVRHATTLVGVRTIKNFVLWSAVFSLVPNPKSGPFDLKSLWQDSLRRGLFARRLGRILGLRDSEDAFSGALLQDMAVPLLAKELPQEYNGLLLERKGRAVRLSTLERECFGWDHAEAAGLMARAWGLPERFADMIEDHLDLERHLANVANDPQRLAVALSAFLPSITCERWEEREIFDEAYAAVRGDGPTAEALLAEVDESFAEFAPLLKLSTPSRSLARHYEEAAAVFA